MKIRFISFFLFMLAMSCLVACSDDDPAPDPEPEPEPVETVNRCLVLNRMALCMCV